MSACIGEPISWLRLERHALDGADATVRDHLARCAACARCLDQIRGDVLAPPLPPLPRLAPAPAAARRRRWWLAPGMACATAAAVAVAVTLGGLEPPGAPRRPAPDLAPDREDIARIKGVGEIVLGVVRERGGAIRQDARTFAPGDRWKVVVTCPPAASAWIDVAVHDAGQIDRPLPPARVGCGNRVVLPGAFSLTGGRPNRVCVRVRADAAPDPAGPPDACVTLRPE